MAVEDFGGKVGETPCRDRLRRSPEQGRYRFEPGAAMVRRRRRRHDRRCAEFRRGARRQRNRQGEEQGLPDLRRRKLGAHRRQMLAQYGPLDLRHLVARQRYRQGDRIDRRRFVVLHHRRLRLRPCARKGHCRGGRRQRRQGGGCGAPPAQQCRFLLVPPPGAVLGRQDHRPGQRRRRYHQRDQAGRRIRHRGRRSEPCRPVDLPHRRARAGSSDCSGTDLHRSRSTGTPTMRRGPSPRSSRSATAASIRR